MTNDKALIIAARVISMIFTPFYLPLIGIAVLLAFTFMSGFPIEYKLVLVTVVYLTTVFIPTLLIFLYRRLRGWTLQEMGQKRNRMVPYAISFCCYLGCIWLMYATHVNHIIISIIVAALLIQAVSILITIWWKISTHTAAIGGVSGALIAFGFVFGFNPVWWLCLVFILAGILGTSRMILRQHSLAQVVTGFFVGVVCSILGLVYL